MEAAEKIDAYIEKQVKWKEGLTLLRKALNESEFREEVKWGMPTYTIDGKNLIGLSGFKNHFGLWFFQGVFLSDPHKLLTNAQEGKTKGMRHIKFYDSSEVDLDVIKPYLDETIKNHKEGKVIKSERKKESYKMPQMLEEALKQNGMESFAKLSKSKQNEYLEYIVTAKREATKKSRIEKIVPMIQNGVGLNDMYKK